MSTFTTYDAVLGSTTLRQVQNVNVTSNGQVVNGTMSSGLLGQLFGGQKDIRAAITTQDVGAVAASPMFNVSAGTITIPAIKRADMATFSSGSDHYALSGTKGMVVANSFSASDTGAATAEVEVIFLSTDGATAPVSESSAASLAAEAFAGLYSLGPVSINSTLVDCARSMNISTGVRIEPEFCNGNNYAITAFNKPPITPSISIEGPGLGQFLGAIGGWTTGTALVGYLRKRTTAGFVADNVAEHIKFSFADGILDAGWTAANGGDASKSITFRGEILVITPNSVIA